MTVVVFYYYNNNNSRSSSSNKSKLCSITAQTHSLHLSEFSEAEDFKPHTAGWTENINDVKVVTS